MTQRQEVDFVEGYMLVVTNPPVGPNPLKMTCPHCKKVIISTIKPKVSAKTHLTCIIFVLIGCCLFSPCVYCNDSWKATEHTCPECKNYLGTYDG